MLGLFSAVKGFVPKGKKVIIRCSHHMILLRSSLQSGAPVTEGLVAVLHYRITTLLIMGCCILVTALDWIGNGNSITCVMEGDSDSWTIPPKVSSAVLRCWSPS